LSAQAVNLNFFQMEMVAAVDTPKPFREPEPLPPPEEADVALEEVVDEPEPEPEPEREPELELDPVESESMITQDASAHQTQVDVDSLQRWVLQQIESVKYYPPSAQRIGMEGVFELSVTVGRDGAIVSAEVLGGKGHSFLRRALERMMLRLPGRSFGQPVGQEIEIPLEFSFDLE
jgi:TonB family protein